MYCLTKFWCLNADYYNTYSMTEYSTHECVIISKKLLFFLSILTIIIQTNVISKLASDIQVLDVSTTTENYSEIIPE